MLKQAAYLLTLRIRMVIRLISNIGWIRALLFAVLLVVFSIDVMTEDSKSAHWMILLMGSMIIATVHTKRPDLAFLHSVGINDKLLVATEYLVLIFPLIIALLLQQSFIPAGLLVVCTVLIPLTLRPGRSQSASKSYRPSSFLWVRSYEWVSGFRRYGVAIIILMILGVAGLHLNYMAGLGALFLITANVSAFYAECEPLRLIVLTASSVKELIFKKIIQGVGLYTICTLPVWLYSVILYPEQYGYTVLFWVLNISLLSFMILSKYAFYEEHRSIEIPLGIFFVTISFCLAVPYLQIILIPLGIYLLIKSNRRLKTKVYA